MPTGLYCYLSYADAPGAIAWLRELGFEVVARQDADDGSVAHCELRLGNAVVMLSSFDADYQMSPLVGHSVGHGVYLLTDRADEMHDRGVAAGGVSVLAPHDTEWGTRRARVLDPGGNEWSFGSYEPGAAWS